MLNVGYRSAFIANDFFSFNHASNMYSSLYRTEAQNKLTDRKKKPAHIERDDLLWRMRLYNVTDALG